MMIQHFTVVENTPWHLFIFMDTHIQVQTDVTNAVFVDYPHDPSQIRRGRNNTTYFVHKMPRSEEI